MKTRNLSVVNLKKTCNLDGSTPEPAIWLCDADQHIPRFDSCQLTTTWMCNIRTQAPTLARKFLVVQTDGRVGGHMLTQLDRQTNFLSYGVPLAWSSANNIIKYVVKEHKHRLKNWSYEPAVTQHQTMQAH